MDSRKGKVLELSTKSVKISKFSVTQILREITISKSRVSKFAITHLEALDFEIYEIVTLFEVEHCN